MTAQNVQKFNIKAENHKAAAEQAMSAYLGRTWEPNWDREPKVIDSCLGPALSELTYVPIDEHTERQHQVLCTVAEDGTYDVKIEAIPGYDFVDGKAEPRRLEDMESPLTKCAEADTNAMGKILMDAAEALENAELFGAEYRVSAESMMTGRRLYPEDVLDRLIDWVDTMKGIVEELEDAREAVSEYIADGKPQVA